MAEQVKTRASGGHELFHNGEWLTVKMDNGEWVIDEMLVVVCGCDAPVEMFVDADRVYARREKPE